MVTSNYNQLSLKLMQLPLTTGLSTSVFCPSNPVSQSSRDVLKIQIWSHHFFLKPYKWLSIVPQMESNSLTWSTNLCMNWLLSTFSCLANLPFSCSLLPAQGSATGWSLYLEHLPGLGYLAGFSPFFRSWLHVFLSVNPHPQTFGRVRFLPCGLAERFCCTNHNYEQTIGE